ncbi:MAG: hypothetical protein VYC31_00290 [Pseudomonadota bacterium]|nr:hypothetical protein [Pseudomonadota bacterium]
MTDLTLKPTTAPAPTRPTADPASAGWGGDGFGFNDFLDLINPLQHVPGVSTLYRAVTGDAIADEARFIGHIVYGGPLGLIAATAETLATDRDGRGLSENLAAWWGGEAETAVAARRPGPPTALHAPRDSAATEAAAADRALAPTPPATPKSAAALTAESASLQQVRGDLLDAFIQRQNSAPAATSKTPGAAAAAPLAPPPTAGGADGAQLAQWMMHALDRYRQQAGQR